METRDLKSFLAVIRRGSFTAAARELGYTQSAVSQQIAALERDVGQQLVCRRPVHATAAGERLAEHASRILLRLDVARSELARLDSRPQELVVAVCPLAAPRLLAAALRQVRSTSPGLRVTVRSIIPASAVAEMASGSVDVALVDGIVGPDEPLNLADTGLLSSFPLVTSSLVVALPGDHPLRHRPSIDLDVLVDAPWIAAPVLAGTDTGAPWQGPVPPTPRSRPAAVVYQGSDLPTLLALVAAGHGVALLPAPACSGAPGIAVVALGSPRLVHRTELLTLRSPSIRIEPLVQTLREMAAPAEG